MKIQPGKCHLPKWDQGRFDRCEKFSLSPNLGCFFSKDKWFHSQLVVCMQFPLGSYVLPCFDSLCPAIA